ncbi:TPA: hypothetical protein DCX16_02285 [bacterium]|nr:hypothetical protein [bacterium]
MADFALRAFIAHVVSDLLLQPDLLSKKKKKAMMWLLIHGAITFICLIFFGWGIISIRWILFSLLLSLSHIIVDFIRIRIGRKGVVVGIIDQLVHFGFMALFLILIY